MKRRRGPSVTGFRRFAKICKRLVCVQRHWSEFQNTCPRASEGPTTRLGSAGGRQLRDSRDTQDPRGKREQSTSLTHFRGAETGRPWYLETGKMVVTRSARPPASTRATSPENSQQEVGDRTAPSFLPAASSRCA